MDNKKLLDIAGISAEKQELLAYLLAEEGVAPAATQTILPRLNTAPAPLSFAQQRLWFLDQLIPGSSLYNIPLAVRLTGHLNVPALLQTFTEIVQRHESLRTTFPIIDGRPIQQIAPAPTLRPLLVNMRTIPETRRKVEVQRLVKHISYQPFDLVHGPLFRLVLLQLDTAEHVLLLTMHHIISDDWSIRIFIREVSAVYQAFTSNTHTPLPSLPIQYADFALWQREKLQGQVLQTQLDYWKQQLADIPMLPLPYTQPRAAVQTFRGGSKSLLLPAALRADLKRLSQQEGVSLFMTLLAAFNLLLYRHTGQEIVVVGSPVANRNYAEIEDLIGFFVNNLVLRTDLSGNPRFRELLQRVHKIAIEAYAHQELPFEKLVEELQPERAAGHIPLHQVAFVFQSNPPSNLNLPDLKMSIISVESKVAKNDIVLFIDDTEQGLRVRLKYNVELFKPATISQMLAHFEMLLTSLAVDPDQRIEMLPLFQKEIATSLAIAPSSLEKVSPLTPTQRDLYLAQLIDPEITTYSEGGVISLGTELKVDLWQKAVTFVIENDEITRTRTFSYQGKGFQFINRDNPIPFEFIDFTQPDSSINNLDELAQKKIKIPYDLHNGPLFNNILVKDHDGQYLAVFAWSHILLDAYSLKLFFEMVGIAYEALANGRLPAQTNDGSFYDYVGDYLARFDTKEIREFWTQHLSDVAPLPLHSGLNSQGKRIEKRVSITREHLAEIKEYCQAVGCSLPAYLKALAAILLGKYFDSADDFVIYDVIGLRSRENANTLGCFYQVVPIRIPRNLLKSGGTILEYLHHIYLHYVQRIGRMHHISVLSQNRILQREGLKFFYNYYKFYAIADLLGETRRIRHYKSFPDDEVHFIVDDLDETIELAIFFNEKCFSDLNFLDRILSLSQQLVAGVENLHQLDILLPTERRRLLEPGSNISPIQYANNSCIHQLFETQVTQTPDAVALVFEGQHLTYGELNRRANQLAHHLQGLGVRPESRVGLCVERSLEMIIGILGILKAGGAYLPLPPIYPPDRLTFMTVDAQISILLTQEHLADSFSTPEISSDLKVVNLDAQWATIAQAAQSNPFSSVTAANQAYVIYTSGSSGKPKGVMVNHANVGRLLAATENWFHFDQSDVWTLFHSYAFDFSVWELWGSLCYGGRLIVIPHWVSRSPDTFYGLLGREQVTVLNQTPLAFYQLIRAEEQPANNKPALDLRLVIFGGEALDLQSLRPWFERHGDQSPTLINMYGITETTVHVTYQPLTIMDVNEASGSIIGYPIPDLQVHIVDENMQPVPIGLAGEMLVGGAGLSRGYLGRPGLTAEKFIPNPFADDEEKSAFNLYKTGDLARILPTGNIEFLGRIDHQVKIRGFRIELGEIEALLNQHPDVQKATVLAREDEPGHKRLVAYVVAKAQIQSELRPYLKEKLPAYMVPAAFVMLDALPLTANGKVDRRALPSPDQERPTLETAHVAPQGKLEQAIATIWQEILQVERVGIYDNFFDLGGHSLLVVETQQRLRQILNREIPVTELFKYTTVATLATHLGQEQTDKDNRHDEVVQKTKARAAERRRSLPRWTRQRRQKPVSPEDGE